MTLNFGAVEGLPETEQKQLNNLARIYNYHRLKNARKQRYYNGHISLAEMNLGIALPRNMSKLDIGCSWGQKRLTCWHHDLCLMDLLPRTEQKRTR